MANLSHGLRARAHLLTQVQHPVPVERRVQARLPLTFAVRQEHLGVVTYHESRDVSAGGMRLDWGLRMPVGTQVILRFTLPGEVGQFKLPAVVVANSWDVGAPSTSLRFSSVQGDVLSRIARFVERHLTMPWSSTARR